MSTPNQGVIFVISTGGDQMWCARTKKVPQLNQPVYWRSNMDTATHVKQVVSLLDNSVQPSKTIG